MIRYLPFGAIMWLLIAPPATAQQEQSATTDANRIELGRLAIGAAVTFVRAGSGDWGIEISGGAAPAPGATEARADRGLSRRGRTCASLPPATSPWKRKADAVVARAKVAGEGEAAFAVEDRWKVSGAVLSLSRKVSVTGAEDNAGFYSAIRLATEPAVKWEDVSCLVPGLLYGDGPGRASTPKSRPSTWRLFAARSSITWPTACSPWRTGPACWRCPDARTTCWAPAGSRNTGGWDRTSAVLEPTVPGCRGFPSTTCTASPAWKSSIRSCINDWPKGIDVRRNRAAEGMRTPQVRPGGGSPPAATKRTPPTTLQH